MNTLAWISALMLVPSFSFALPPCTTHFGEAAAMFAQPPISTNIATMKASGRPDGKNEASIWLKYNPDDPNIYAELHFSAEHIYTFPLQVCRKGDTLEVIIFGSKIKPKREGGPKVPDGTVLPEQILLTVKPAGPRSLEYYKEDGKLFLTSSRPTATAGR